MSARMQQRRPLWSRSGVPIQIVQRLGVLCDQPVQCHGPAFGAPAHRAGQVASRDGRRSTGQHEIAQGRKALLQGVNPLLEPFHLSARHPRLSLPRSIGVRKHAANAEQVILDVQQHFVLWPHDAVVPQSTHDGVEFVDGAVSLDPGVVLVDAGSIEKGGFPSISGAGVDAHGAKVRFFTQPMSKWGRRRCPRSNLRIVERDEKQRRYDRAYLRMAREWAALSHCRRKQVGALIVRDGMIVSDGYNGTPSGFPNACEDVAGDTHWYVLHAEANAITKLARSSQTAAGATLYITMSPCRECAKLIHQVGIRRLVYIDAYKDDSGLQFLNQAGVEIVRCTDVD